ncbi:MAG TPA: TetR family transcriptional regulator C-terminal domain-containing protein, partial [Caldilineaceae bacterium]|nr:TetR family transcriptional regulator C-terminal domain-containing protein [Caldilineaceae bacterium]
EVAAWRADELGYAVPAGEEKSEGPTFLEVIRRDKLWNLLLLEFLLYALREESVRQQVADRLYLLNQQLGQHLARVVQRQGGTPPLPIDELSWVVNALGTGLSLLAYLDPEHFPADLYEPAFSHLLGISTPLSPGQ